MEEERSLEYNYTWHQLRPCEAEGTTDISCHHAHVVPITPLYSFEHVPIQTTLYVFSYRQHIHFMLKFMLQFLSI